MTKSRLKSRLRRLFLETLEGLSLEGVMAERVVLRGTTLSLAGESIDLADYENIFVAAIGKAARPMATALAARLPAERTEGVIVSSVAVSSSAEGQAPANFRAFLGGHPYPNEQSVAAAEHIVERLTALGERDLVIFLLSGGGSAICEAAIDETISLDDLRAFYEVLVTCGANIVDMNVLRKHVSRIKGGKLALRAYPARQITLYVSDVPPDEPSTVASGPTMPDESTVAIAYKTAGRLGIVPRLPTSIRRLFEERALLETPKPGQAVFAKSTWRCLLDNLAALDLLEAKAREQGWVVERDLSVDDRPVAEAADILIERLRALSDQHPTEIVAVLTGGELSSPVTGDGMGGRNLAFVLWVARRLAERGMKAAVVSAGTDGIDGNSPAAGALADGLTIERAEAMGMDAADFDARSDSYYFFRDLDDLLVTGPTSNNVRDLRMLVTGPKP